MRTAYQFRREPRFLNCCGAYSGCYQTHGAIVIEQGRLGWQSMALVGRSLPAGGQLELRLAVDTLWVLEFIELVNTAGKTLSQTVGTAFYRLGSFCKRHCIGFLWPGTR